MADDVSPGPRPRYKTRSASISAPASESMENVLMPTASTGTPEGSGYRRRKPATRSQSARITGARSVRKGFLYIPCYTISTSLKNKL